MEGFTRNTLSSPVPQGHRLEFARQFAREGVHVCLLDRREDDPASAVSTLRAAGSEATAVAMDVTKRADVIAVVEAAEAEARIDVFVNNAWNIKILTIKDIERGESNLITSMTAQADRKGFKKKIKNVTCQQL